MLRIECDNKVQGISIEIFTGNTIFITPMQGQRFACRFLCDGENGIRVETMLSVSNKFVIATQTIVLTTNTSVLGAISLVCLPTNGRWNGCP
jgi:hypothetical protein